MPRPGPRRPLMSLRVDAETLTTLDDLAARLGVTRSDLVRRMIEKALTSWQAP